MQFFDKMKNKVGPALTEASHKLKEGVDHVAAAANEKLHENKLKNQLHALLREKDEKLLALGAKVFELHCTDGIGIDDLTAELAALEALEVQIVAKKSEFDSHNAGPPPAQVQSAGEE